MFLKLLAIEYGPFWPLQYNEKLDESVLFWCVQMVQLLQIASG